MTERIIVASVIGLFFLGFIIVGAIQDFIQNRRRLKQHREYLWKRDFLHNFQEVVEWKGNDTGRNENAGV